MIRVAVEFRLHNAVRPHDPRDVDSGASSDTEMNRRSRDRLLLGQEGAEELGGVNERITLILKICDALSWAHAHGVIHCDIKPGNILVGRFGEAFLLDWGAARASDSSRHEGAMGTPLYTSPEQARGEVATAVAVRVVYAVYSRVSGS